MLVDRARIFVRSGKGGIVEHLVLTTGHVPDTVLHLLSSSLHCDGERTVAGVGHIDGE